MVDFQKRKTPSGYFEAFPRPDQRELEAFYQEQYWRDGVTVSYHTQYTDDEILQKQLRAAATVEAIAQSAGNSDISFLEIGSGEGFLLASAMQRGWRCRGVDFQRGPVENFNPAALDAFVAANPAHYLDERIRDQEKFSIVALQHVLEHALEPDALMGRIRNILQPRGLFFVQVPNDYSPLQEAATARGLIDKEHWFLPPQHLNYFNIKTFTDYAAGHGFKILDMFADFPIEFYLWGNQTNYVRDKSFGPLAHKARVELDLLMSKNGIEKYLNFYRALSAVGMGRNLCAILTPAT
jgi:2-polyprenyl-3-methyl-5-hydroxy-6-metoxy-1,4-benzoquinol methylase